MRIFLSHASHNKALLREIRSKLPDHIDAWIDEKQLLVGDNLSQALEGAISTETDFVVLFVDREAMASPWVRQEIEWALNVERTMGRTFVLPVVLDRAAWEQFEPADFRNRKYISYNDYTEEGSSALARALSDQLFAWLDRDYDRLRKGHQPAETADTPLDDADQFLQTVATKIHTIVDPYRLENPLDIGELHSRMSSIEQVARLDQERFLSLLDRLQRESLLPGIYFDEDEIYIEEQPWIWKIKASREAKRRIAKAAFRMIQSGQVIALDGGSTTAMIAQQIARSVTTNRLSSITVITNSLPAASELFQAASDLGLKDHDNRLRIVLAGGHIRPTTAAVVALNPEDTGAGIRRLIEAIGKVDISFVGTSGVAVEGFSTRTREEAQTKQALLAPGARHVIVTDPSKFGFRHKNIFARLSDAEILTSKEDLDESKVRALTDAGATITCA